MANDRCRDLEFATGPQTPVDFDFFLQSKDSQSTEYQFVVDIKDYCAQGITYTVFWPNDWILK